MDRSSLTADAYAEQESWWREVEALSTSSSPGSPAEAPIRPRLSVQQLLAAKEARPLRSVAELAADTFDSDQEVADFLADLYASRRSSAS